MSEAWITVLSCHSRNISQKGRNRLRRSKKVSYKHWVFRHRHTCDSWSWQHCVVIPLAKHLARTMGKVETAKECVVPRHHTEGGRTKVRQVLRYHLYKCNATASAIHYLLPSCLIRFPFSHMHSVHFSAFSMHYAQCKSRPWRHTNMRRITDITQ
jgi:hypothetical protein